MRTREEILNEAKRFDAAYEAASKKIVAEQAAISNEAVSVETQPHNDMRRQAEELDIFMEKMQRFNSENTMFSLESMQTVVPQ